MPETLIIETKGNLELKYDIWSRLIKDRIIFILRIPQEYEASVICAQLLFLQLQDRKKEIAIYINSPGGWIEGGGLAVYDTMKHVANPIATYCLGEARGVAALLLAAGTKGRRFILPHARVMLYQPYDEVYGQASDISIAAEEIIRVREKLVKILARHTGQPEERVARDLERDKWMSAEEAVAYGIADQVLIAAEAKKEEKA